MELNVAAQAPLGSTLPIYLGAEYVKLVKGKQFITVALHDGGSLPGEATEAAVTLKTSEGSEITSDESKIWQSFTSAASSNPDASSPPVAQTSDWMSMATALNDPTYKRVEPLLAHLNGDLTLRTYICGHTLSTTDLIVWGTLRANNAAYANIKRNTMINLCRWFRFIEESNPWINKAVATLNSHRNEVKTAKAASGASYDIALPDTEKGVVTRFPPEPSGYLHIGHAKAALLNDYFAHEMYKGTLLLRFDDTNPSKEKAEFEDSIVEDLALMGIKPDKASHTSDWFAELYEYCVQMIKEGNAYADDTPQEKMREERMDGIASARRDRSVEENLKILEEMKAGTELGLKNCIRAKISFSNPNKAMRDPVIYRCNLTPHHRTGSTWKIYPTYDFCCPIVDSLEGVTHALRTVEYRDRNPQYEWMIHTLKLRPVHIWDFARMNFVRTLLSKRKLTQFVEAGRVWGWDDPRFPTVRGIRRRGMTIEALREFILKQGPSKNIVNLDWTLFWATNKKFVDPVAPRHTAVAEKDSVLAVITLNGPEEAYTEQKPKHAKNPALGMKTVLYGPKIVIEQEDALSFAVDEEITLMAWGNAIVRKITYTSPPPPHPQTPSSSSAAAADSTATANAAAAAQPLLVSHLELELHLEGDFKKTSKKITFLASASAATLGSAPVPIELVNFDFLITKDKLDEGDDVEDFLTPQTEFRTKAFGDCNVKGMREGDIVQFERKGYYRLDEPYSKGPRGEETPAVFFAIPSGRVERK